jgi:hypothetical protein
VRVGCQFIPSGEPGICTEVEFTDNLEADAGGSFAVTSEEDFLHPHIKITDKQLRKIEIFDFISFKI